MFKLKKDFPYLEYMSEIIVKLENLEDVIEKNKEKFSLKDCHNFVAYLNAIKEGVINLEQKLEANVENYNQIQEILGTGHNTMMQKLNNILGEISTLKSSVSNNKKSIERSGSVAVTLKTNQNKIKEDLQKLTKLEKLEENIADNNKKIVATQSMYANGHNSLIKRLGEMHTVSTKNDAIIAAKIDRVSGIDQKQNLETIEEEESVNEVQENTEVENESDEKEETNVGEQRDEDNNDSEDLTKPNVTLKISDKEE